jgi:hypothetical protein
MPFLLLAYGKSILGGDLAGERDAVSPGSGAASPYRPSIFFSLVGIDPSML